MKQIQISLRLNQSEYEQLKRQSAKNHLTISQMLRDLIHGKRCFCQHQNIFNNLSADDSGDERTAIISKTFELVYENLILLRDYTAITHPELTDLATEKRLAFFEEDDED